VDRLALVGSARDDTARQWLDGVEGSTYSRPGTINQPCGLTGVQLCDPCGIARYS